MTKSKLVKWWMRGLKLVEWLRGREGTVAWTVDIEKQRFALNCCCRYVNYRTIKNWKNCVESFFRNKVIRRYFKSSSKLLLFLIFLKEYNYVYFSLKNQRSAHTKPYMVNMVWNLKDVSFPWVYSLAWSLLRFTKYLPIQKI